MVKIKVNEQWCLIGILDAGMRINDNRYFAIFMFERTLRQPHPNLSSHLACLDLQRLCNEAAISHGI